LPQIGAAPRFSVTAITPDANGDPKMDRRHARLIPEILAPHFPIQILSFFPAGEKVETGPISDC
jgi:hypothetical protein